jgi:hypothetical protein
MDSGRFMLEEDDDLPIEEENPLAKFERNTSLPTNRKKATFSAEPSVSFMAPTPEGVILLK